MHRPFIKRHYRFINRFTGQVKDKVVGEWTSHEWKWKFPCVMLRWSHEPPHRKVKAVEYIRSVRLIIDVGLKGSTSPYCNVTTVGEDSSKDTL